jgi:predicted SnoaL-like aldol condensation-catalyzing enzyme
MDDCLERNQRTAIPLYDLMFNQGKLAEAIEKYAGDTYIQRTPHVPDGNDGFISYFNRMAKKYPGKRGHFKSAFAEGNHVILHCHQGGPATKTEIGHASTSSDSTIKAGSLNTGMCCRSPRRPRLIATACSEQWGRGAEAQRA